MGRGEGFDVAQGGGGLADGQFGAGRVILLHMPTSCPEECINIILIVEYDIQLLIIIVQYVESPWFESRLPVCVIFLF